MNSCKKSKIKFKSGIIIISFLLITVGCSINWYGDINLGGNYYYMVDPDCNSINVPVNPMKPYRSSSYVIKDVEQVGFDQKHILVISNTEGEIIYWWIDKTKECKKLNFVNNSILIMSNNHRLDSIRFNQILKETGIELKSKLYYQEKLNYK